jgi:hypothetical protein
MGRVPWFGIEDSSGLDNAIPEAILKLVGYPGEAPVSLRLLERWGTGFRSQARESQLHLL